MINLAHTWPHNEVLYIIWITNRVRVNTSVWALYDLYGGVIVLYRNKVAINWYTVVVFEKSSHLYVHFVAHPKAFRYCVTQCVLGYPKNKNSLKIFLIYILTFKMSVL